jgi:hypothetical protein
MIDLVGVLLRRKDEKTNSFKDVTHSFYFNNGTLNRGQDLNLNSNDVTSLTEVSFGGVAYKVDDGTLVISRVYKIHKGSEDTSVSSISEEQP